nr:DUF4329 domain-containing protein [Zophobihabitans entericus]
MAWVDPVGLRKASVGGFPTAEAAARAALKRFNPQSIYSNKEYAGLIYKMPDGSYGYTKARIGTVERSNPHKSKNRLPKCATVVGDYHTHGAYKDKYKNKVSEPNNNFDVDKFSPADYAGIRTDASRSGVSNYTGYLGTPSGKFYKWTPGGDSLKF